MPEEREPELVSVYAGPYLKAEVMKSHLESEGIPAILRYEGAGLVYGITVDGLGEARVLVPAALADEARAILQPRESFGNDYG